MDLFSEHLVLENKTLLLYPSTQVDKHALFELADPRIWTHSSTNIQSMNDMETYLQRAIEARQHKKSQQLTIKRKRDNQLIGCSTFENIFFEHQRLEIGWTWLGKDYQGKGLNRIAKFLMLQYVFEQLQFERVEFRARGTNIQSQKALKKIGATREGTLRSYFQFEGQRHDFVYFSILKSEWTSLKETVFNDLNSTK